MTVEDAQKILEGGQTDFDYLQGRVMKVDLSEDTLDPWLYDRDNGQGAAERAIAEVRKGQVNSPPIREARILATSQVFKETFSNRKQ